jgi:acyl-CoA thioester hydrolase
MPSHPFDCEVRIPYADVDRMNVLYYGNHFVIFEKGRTELLRTLGMSYKDWEENRGLMLPVLEAHCHYRSPARYDDQIRLRTFLSELSGARITFRYQMIRLSDNKVLAIGATTHAVIGKAWKPIRIPKDIYTKLASVAEKVWHA